MGNTEAVYELYWVREKHHTSITKEGYVGITSTGLSNRLKAHKSSALKGKGWTFQEKIREIGLENMEANVMCVGSFEYIQALELKLRPHPYIGWNHAKGGGGHTPEFARERQKKVMEEMRGTDAWYERIEKYKESMQKYWDDPEFHAKRSKAHKESWVGNDERRRATSERAKKLWEDEDYKRRMTAHTKARWEDPVYREERIAELKDRYKDPAYREKHSKSASESAKRRYANQPWWHHPSCNKVSAEVADEAYELWSTNRWGHKRVEKALGLKLYALDSLIKRFRKGWVPLEDPEWVREFKGVSE